MKPTRWDSHWGQEVMQLDRWGDWRRRQFYVHGMGYGSTLAGMIELGIRNQPVQYVAEVERNTEPEQIDRFMGELRGKDSRAHLYLEARHRLVVGTQKITVGKGSWRRKPTESDIAYLCEGSRLPSAVMRYRRGLERGYRLLREFMHLTDREYALD